MSTQQKQPYLDGGVDAEGSVCSVQRYLSHDMANGVEEHHCPDPDWVDISNDRIINDDGSETLLIYRALRSFDRKNPDQLDYWATKLLNSNTANLPGVLSYLHTEVVPDDMREEADQEDCLRKWGYDAIMVFNVTVKTPPTFKQRFGDMISGLYSAYDYGQCTGSAAVCDYGGVIGGFAPGKQTQDSNPRHEYPGAFWYSFPQCGYCDWPTGEVDCTYTYNVVGMYHIDDLVFPDRYADSCTGTSNGPCRASDGSCNYWQHSDTGAHQCPAGETELNPTETFHSYCEGGGKEYVRHLPVTGEESCLYGTQYRNTISGLDFWYYVCDERMCRDRMQLVTKLQMDTSIARPGEGPGAGSCHAGYTQLWRTYDHTDYQNLYEDKTIDECKAVCDSYCQATCLAFAFEESGGRTECMIYTSLTNYNPAGADEWWGKFFKRNHPEHFTPTPCPTTAAPTYPGQPTPSPPETQAPTPQGGQTDPPTPSPPPPTPTPTPPQEDEVSFKLTLTFNHELQDQEKVTYKGEIKDRLASDFEVQDSNFVLGDLTAAAGGGDGDYVYTLSVAVEKLTEAKAGQIERQSGSFGAELGDIGSVVGASVTLSEFKNNHKKQPPTGDEEGEGGNAGLFAVLAVIAVLALVGIGVFIYCRMGKNQAKVEVGDTYVAMSDDTGGQS